MKTDLKWDSRMFAFVWLSVCSWPLSLRGAMPVLSCLLIEFKTYTMLCSLYTFLVYFNAVRNVLGC